MSVLFVVSKYENRILQDFMMQGQQRYLFGLFSAVVMPLLFTYAMAGCKKQPIIKTSAVDTIPSIVPLPPLRNYLALGDSYTIGEGVPVAERFPHQTMALLKGRGVNMQEPQYIAQTGWPTGSLLYAINATNPPDSFDVVSLLIGVNNQYQRRDTGQYRQEFTQCLKEAIRLAGKRPNRVFVLSIPDYSVTPFAARNSDTARVSREIDQFNKINKQVTDSAGIVWIEITQGSREARLDPSLIANDGLHPSGREYAKWAAKLAEEMTKVLR